MRGSESFLVRDYTEDPYGIDGYRVDQIISLEIRAAREGDVHPLMDNFPENDKMYVVCTLNNGTNVFF